MSRHRTIEITIISGEDLPTKSKNTCVTIHPEEEEGCRRTRIDADSRSHPCWNDKFVLELPDRARFIALRVQSNSKARTKNPPSGSRTVGTACIPTADFAGGYAPENYLRFLSYRLRDDRGDAAGIINVSVRTLTKAGVTKEDNGGPAAAASVPLERQPKDYLNNPSFGSHGVVTGVPAVWYGYRV